jgi:hypothetical protein
MQQIGMKKGIWCHFDHEGHHIAVHLSSWSGKEVVYVNDHPVSEKRNLLKLTSLHTIEVSDKPYTVEVEDAVGFSLTVKVKLKKGRRVLQSQTIALYKTEKQPVFKVLSWLTGVIVIGGLVGYLLGRLIGAGIS